MPEKGFVAACDFTGRIRRVLRDTLPGGFPAGAETLGVLAAEGSGAKVDLFLDVLVDEGAAYNWELNLALESGIETFHFAGFRDRGEAFVVAAASPPALVALVEEMMAINNEYATFLRAKLKGEKTAAPDAAIPGQGVDDMSALNNELVNLSRRLEKTNRELQRANEEKQFWVGVLAHDLRNPIWRIAAYAEFLEMKYGDQLDEKPLEFVRAIRVSGNYMAELVNRTLDFTAIESGKLNLQPEETDLVALSRDVLQLNTPIADRKDIRLEHRCDVEKAVALVDKVKVEQVINNLLGNAIKYTEPGGTVSVTLGTPDGAVSIAVTDSGVGIRPDDVERIFHPFEKGPSPTGDEASTGLGLAICKRIVEGHGGTIEVTSTPGKGSTFKVSLPMN